MGESIPLAAPVPVEQAVLETFFSHLGIFSYDKAKDNVEKEREANKSAGGSWLSLLAALAHLAAAEKVYHSLTYLGQKLGTSAPPLSLRRKERVCTPRSALVWVPSHSRRPAPLCPGLLPPVPLLPYSAASPAHRPLPSLPRWNGRMPFAGHAPNRVSLRFCTVHGLVS